MWVKLAVGFSLGSPVFCSPQKQTFLNSNSIGSRAILKTIGSPVNVLISLIKKVVIVIVIVIMLL